MRRERMPEGVARRVFVNAGGAYGAVNGALDDGLVEVVASVLAAHAIRIDSDRGEHPLARQLAAGVRILSREGVRKLDPPSAGSEIALVESAHARDLPLQCPAHDDLACRELDVLHPQARALEETESGT